MIKYTIHADMSGRFYKNKTVGIAYVSGIPSAKEPVAVLDKSGKLTKPL